MNILVCPFCDHSTPGSAMLIPEDAGPGVGDFLICANCKEVSVFYENSQLRKMDDSDDMSSETLASLADALKLLNIARDCEEEGAHRLKKMIVSIPVSENAHNKEGDVYCFRSLRGLVGPEKLYPHCQNEILKGLKSGTRGTEWVLMQKLCDDATSTLHGRNRKEAAFCGVKLAYLISMMSGPDTNIKDLMSALEEPDKLLGRYLAGFEKGGGD